MITQDDSGWYFNNFFQLLRKETILWGQQMRIWILSLGLKGLTVGTTNLSLMFPGRLLLGHPQLQPVPWGHGSHGIKDDVKLLCQHQSSLLPVHYQHLKRKYRGKNILNAFIYNLKELTTKSIFSAWGPQSFSIHMPSCSLHSSCDSVAWIFPSCCVVHAMRFLSVIFSKPSSTPYSSFSTDILQCDGCLFVLFLWGLMAGLRSCTSHGGTIQSRGWLPKVETPGYSRHPTAPNMHIQILQTGLHTFP